MTFDGLLLHDMLQQQQQHSQAAAGAMGMWDASKLAQFPASLGSLPATQPVHTSDCFPGSELAYAAPALSQGFGAPLPAFSDYTQASQGLQYSTAVHDVQMASFPPVSVPQQHVQVHDAALLQVLQSQLAAANLLASQTQCAQLPLQPALSNGAVGSGMDLLAQGQYYELLNQASLQAVQSVLQQRLMSAQQLAVLQQLLKHEAQSAAPKQSKRNNGNHRNGSSGKHRNGSRHGGRKAGVSQQAPSWADGNWDPMSNVQAKRSKEQQGTGVFLPQGLPDFANESANDQMSEASSDQSSGCTYEVGRQES